MKHKHHIIPKHMGGSDDPSNLIELSIQEHADAHKLLWEEHGKIEDKIAWECLSGRTLTEEDRIVLSKSGYESFRSNKEKVEQWRHSIKQKRKCQVITPEHANNISIGLTKAYEEGRRTYCKPSLDILQENYNNNKTKMDEGRKNSIKWRESVSSEESKQKRRKSDPRSTKIVVDGITYDSIRHAAKETPYSYHLLRKMLKQPL